MKPKKVIGIVGATGMVGQTALELLAMCTFKFDVKTVKLFASKASVGKTINFNGQKITIETPNLTSLLECDAVLFASDADVSRQFIPQLAEKGIFCVDKSSAFRMADVPLVVPEVNFAQLSSSHVTSTQIVASPNCVVIPLAVVTNLVAKTFGLKRMIVSTYQSVSGTGRAAIDVLIKESKDFLNAQDLTPDKSSVYPKAIAFNVFPFIESLTNDGDTGEEVKIISEMQKILNMPTLPIDVTSVRVPTFVGHAMSVSYETDKQFDKTNFVELLKKEKAIKLTKESDFITPREVQGKDEIFVSRIRPSHAFKNGVSLWIAADNLRKGAALNALQIMEFLLTRNA